MIKKALLEHNFGVLLVSILIIFMGAGNISIMTLALIIVSGFALTTTLILLFAKIFNKPALGGTIGMLLWMILLYLLISSSGSDIITKAIH